MAVKRFYAADMHTAMNTIRAQLGEEAIIVSTRKLADGVEISATAGLANTQSSQKESSIARADINGAASMNSGQKPWYLNSINGFEEEHSALHSELNGITSLLQNWMDKQGWDNYATQSPVHAKLWQRYSSMGFSNKRISSILGAQLEQEDIKLAWQQSLQSLSSQIPVINDDLIERGGVFAFVGSAGAGKTTTIGKLATRYVLKHGADSVALITTDQYRIAAHEQLRTFGKILGISIQAVDESNSLEQLLLALQHKKLVLIDTAGINVNHVDFDAQMEQLNKLRSRIKPVLLLAATSQAEVQEREMNAYRTVNPIAAVITKVDEAMRLGEGLGLLIQANCPIAYTCNGQAIPEDLEPASANRIVNQAVSASKQQSMTAEEMITGFGAVYTSAGRREETIASVN